MHELDRYAVAEIKCTECDTQQGVRAYFQYHVRVVNMRNLLVQLLAVLGCCFMYFIISRSVLSCCIVCFLVYAIFFIRYFQEHNFAGQQQVCQMRNEVW